VELRAEITMEVSWRRQHKYYQKPRTNCTAIALLYACALPPLPTAAYIRERKMLDISSCVNHTTQATSPPNLT